MDRSMRMILSFAIAVLYPAVLYFSIVTVIPTKKVEYPKRNYCQEREYDSYTRRYTTNNDCAAEKKSYDERYDEYKIAQDKEREKNVLRAQVGMMLALMTFAVAYVVRDVKEVAGGLVLGAAFSFCGAVSMSIATIDNDTKPVMSIILALCSFVVLVGMMYWFERVDSSPVAPRGPWSPTSTTPEVTASALPYESHTVTSPPTHPIDHSL